MNWLERLNQIKKASGKTNEEISAISGVPKSTVDKVFSGHTKAPSFQAIQAIANSLGYPVDAISNPHEKLDDSAFGFTSKDATPLVGSEYQLLELFRKLNEEGQGRLLDYADDLSQSGKYIKNNQHQVGAEPA